MTAFRHSLTNIPIDELNFIELESSCACEELKLDGRELPRPAGHSCSYVKARNRLLPQADIDARKELMERGIDESNTRFGHAYSAALSRAMDRLAQRERNAGRL